MSFVLVSLLLNQLPFACGEVLRKAETLEQLLKAAEISELVNETRLRGDSRRGAVLFYRSAAACANCHASGDGPSPLGPNLAKLHEGIDAAKLTDEYQRLGVGVVGISSNDIANHPDDAPDKMKIEAAQQGYHFPYLYDANQRVATAYRAACTPDFYIFDADFKLVYRGQMDDTRPKQGTVPTGRDLRAALDALLAGKEIPQPQRPSIGCNIKWKTGAEPDYFNPAGVS